MIRTKRCQYCGKETPFEAAECPYCRGAFVAKPGVEVLDHLAAVKSALSDKYEIVAEIGQGGNATVYQAIQKSLDRKVALKVLLPGLVNDPGYLERFHLEARSIAKLRHPNIVTIYDEGTEQGVHYISMEFLEGKDLHHVVREKGRLEIQEAIEMAKCIAGALDFAHSYGIVHRDVKSSNIIMTSTRTAVLTDFGIAQSGVNAPHTKSGSLLGTPEFMSPEQAAGRTVDSRTDFYSLGVVLYHTLSGHYPFQGESPITTIHKILYENPVPLGRLVKLPHALERAIERCLVKDPEMRVRNGKELIELLTCGAQEDAPRTGEIPAPLPPEAAPKRPAKRETDAPAPRTVPGAVGSPAPMTVPRPAETPVPRAELRPADAPARRTVSHSPEPPPPKTAPRSSQVQAARRATGSRRSLLGVGVVAIVACLALTGYIAWQRIPAPEAEKKTEQTAPGAMPERRLVPFLIGATTEEAIKLIKREGFELGSVSVVAVPNADKKGKVDSQRPSHGSVAKPGTTVDLLIGE
jgi:serine/threonine protein kinase